MSILFGTIGTRATRKAIAGKIMEGNFALTEKGRGQV